MLRDRSDGHGTKTRGLGEQWQDPIAAIVFETVEIGLWNGELVGIETAAGYLDVSLERRGTSASSRLGSRILRTMGSTYGNKAGHLAAN